MTEPDTRDPDLARTTAQMQSRHKEEGSRLQHAIDGVTAIVALPGSVLVIGVMMFGWVVINLVLARMGSPIADPAPFPGLQTIVSVVGLLLVALVLITQRREDQLADLRAQLNLELSIAIDQKTAKIIELLEEARRDNPGIADRVDHHAAALSTPSDPEVVLEAIKDRRDEKRDGNA